MKNIIFDLGSVILKDKPISILKKFNLNETEYNELSRFFDDWSNLDYGYQTLEDKLNQCNYSDEILNKYKKILLNYYEYRDINLELVELIKKLKQNNYNIFVLSDNNKQTYEYYLNNELFSNIDGWVLSCEYNTIKKDGKLFEIIIDKYNLNPKECYFIDDRKINIEIANKYGIKGFIFNEKDDINNLYEDMKNNGINIL